MHDHKLNDLSPLVAQIVAAYVSNHKVEVAELPQLIRDIHTSFYRMQGGGSAAGAPRPEPAVNPKKSVTAEHIICLEDGEKMKMLKRHLKTSHNMTLEQYRERWNLPADYPMVAPNYAKARSKLAKQIGLGTRGKSRADKK
jgi:predicted transcriptional regulator